MIQNNPLYDEDFLQKLESQTHREIFVRITALTMDELPIETIEGRATGGSINVDGSSALRRTCNLTLVAKELNINDFYWGLKTKIKLEVGLTNDINSNYPDIIWFNQGIYVLTTFNTQHTTNNYQISLTAKDKMCLLNGDLGGVMTSSVNFSEIETYDTKTGITTIDYIPIKTIIREAVHTYGKEPYNNIIINDVEDYGVELLEYRGEEPIFFFQPIDDDSYTNMTIYGDTKVFVENSDEVIELKDVKCKTLVSEQPEDPTIIQLAKIDKYGNYFPSTQKYYVAKVEYSQTAGYRKTPLTWPNAGDSPLVANVGESLTSILDKINNTFYGNYEYFYDIDGHFIFQKKKTYIQTTWNPIKDNGDGIYVDNSIENSDIIYDFKDSKMITSFTNTPNLANLKNDYSIWGVRESISGSQIPIHLRYAIDIKPTYYKTYNGIEYTTEKYDWRELLYQMACDYLRYNLEDDFLYKLANNNKDYYPSGYTGYEQYYTDIQGFWRQLYCYGIEQSRENGDIPDPDYDYYKINEKNEYELQSYIIHWLSTNQIPDLYIKRMTEDGQEVLDQNNKVMYKKVATQADSIEFRNSIKYNHIKIDNMTTYYTLNENGEYTLFNLPEEDENNIFEYLFYADTIYYRNAEKIGYYTDTQGSPVSINLQNYSPVNYWNSIVVEHPENLNFWFDFLDQYGTLSQYQVPAVGDRSKVINDSSITAIYFRETPTVLFVQNEEDKIDSMGYTWIQLPKSVNLDSIFTISSQKKSAQEQLDNLLYNYSYCTESVSTNIIPIYRLEPNRIISIQDNETKINGKYIISRISIPLSYNGTMSINAIKTVERLY